MNYPAGDFLIRLKNASLAKKRSFEVVKSKFVLSLAKALKKEGYLDKITEEDRKLKVRLTYRKKRPLIMDLHLVSKPGLRVYMSVDDLEKIKKPSILILSTPKGIMNSKEAIKERIGGEVVVEIL